MAAQIRDPAVEPGLTRIGGPEIVNGFYHDIHTSRFGLAVPPIFYCVSLVPLTIYSRKSRGIP